jgi:N-acetyl-gamma-glutamyl-phosphate reductase/acetylglutamate kinase
VHATSKSLGGARSFSTSTRRRDGTRGGYTPVESPKKVALIGARGFTGSQLVKIIDSHPSLQLSHVSSRELAGKRLEGYNKAPVDYSNLSVEDVKKLEESGEVDAWIMALPNGVCKPFVDAIQSAKTDKKSVIVDLSADYRFEDSWTYGLPGG